MQGISDLRRAPPERLQDERNTDDNLISRQQCSVPDGLDPRHRLHVIMLW